MNRPSLAVSATMGEKGLQSPVSEAELHEIFQQALGRDTGLSQLKGFKLDLSANKDFHRAYFAARCQCGTSALLSVEMGKDKTLEEVREVLPSLMTQLRSSEQAFRSMSCEMHARMRTGG